jgi:hypothetical protein
VKGKHAHAWPEVYLAGIGWVAFEPTPGRGEPGAEGYTGVAPAQDGGAPATPEGSLPTTPTSVATPGGGPQRETGHEEDILAVPDLRGGGSSGGSVTARSASALSRLAIGVLAALVVGVIGLFIAAVVRERAWRRRWAAASGGSAQVLVTWRHTLDGLQRAGVEVASSDTPREIAVHAAPAVGDAQSLDELAEQVTVAAFAEDTESTDPARCEELRTNVQRGTLARLSIGQRVIWRLRPA